MLNVSTEPSSETGGGGGGGGGRGIHERKWLLLMVGAVCNSYTDSDFKHRFVDVAGFKETNLRLGQK